MKENKIPTKELNFSFSRSSGAGGQNINKVNTKVELRWNIRKTLVCKKDVKERFLKKYSKKILPDGTVVVTSQRFRTQARNIADTIDKLHEMINSVAVAPKKRKKTKPTKSSIEKRLKIKKSKSDIKKSRRKAIDYD